MDLKGKHIILGVCGGIAAYKSIELLRLLTAKGAEVRVIMTGAAENFIGPLSFEVLSHHPVYRHLFEKGSCLRHIEWAQWAHGVIIAPATANLLAKYAHGLADDALSTFLLAVTCPVLVCPAMNSQMYANQALQTNLDILAERGICVPEPEPGALACGDIGPGRLLPPAVIMGHLEDIMSPKDFKNKKFLVTAGPTREALDPVRYISNPSSGKMGFAIATAAAQRGADVTLVSGPTVLTDPLNMEVIRIESASEMATVVFEHFEKTDVVVKAAAVSDYYYKKPASQKMKKTKDRLLLELEKTTDILKALGERKCGQILVGFAAETQDLEKYAQNKLMAKNLDLIVANLINTPASGFGVDTNKVILFYQDGRHEKLAVMDKNALAHLLLDRIRTVL